MTIPFENFVIDPLPYLQYIESALNSKMTRKTKKVMKQQKVPRRKISDGIPLEIYKRCGWEPPTGGLTEREELIKRREYAINEGAGDAAIETLDEMSKNYEEKYLQGII